MKCSLGIAAAFNVFFGILELECFERFFSYPPFYDFDPMETYVNRRSSIARPRVFLHLCVLGTHELRAAKCNTRPTSRRAL